MQNIVQLSLPKKSPKYWDKQNIVKLSLLQKIPQILGYAKYHSIIVTKKNPPNIGIRKISFIIVTRKKSPKYWDTQNIVKLSLLQKIPQISGYAKYHSIIVTKKNPPNIGIRKISFNYRYRKKSPKYWDKQNIVKLSLLQKIPQISGYAKYHSIIVTKKNPPNIGIRKISFNYSYQKKSPKYWDTQNIVQLSLPIKRPKISGYAKYRSIIVTNKNPPNIGICKISSNYRYRKKSPKYRDTQNIVQLSLPIKRPKISGYAKYRSIIVTNKKAQNIGIRKISFNYRYRKKSPKYWDMQNIVQLSLPIKRPKISGYAKYRSIIVTNKKAQNIGIRKISFNYRYRKKSPNYWDTQNIVQLSLLQKNSQNWYMQNTFNYRYRKNPQNIGDKQNIVKLSLLQKIPQILGYAKYHSIIVTKKNPQNIGIRKISFNYRYQ